MKTIIIPGFGISNKPWAEETVKKLAKVGIKSSIYPWKHWTGSQMATRDQVEDIKTLMGDENVNIIAKSIGTYVLSLLISKTKGQIQKIILCGIPINDLEEDDLDNYKEFGSVDPRNIVCFQNNNDSHGSIEQIRDFLKNINSEIEVISKPASTHDYPYYQDFIEFLQAE